MSVFDLIPLQAFPDVWYDDFVTSVAGSAVWVIAFFAIGFYLLRWMNNTKKFYAALERQKAAEEAGEMGGGG
ncbi:MAG: hypothetical protein ACE5EW_05040 [Thermoplasmata archaeon]